MEECPSAEIIRQYLERYGLTAVMRGGTHWEAVSAMYTNPTYGYTVTLPQGIVALSSLPPSPQHGFLIDVGEEMSQPSNASAGHSWLELEAGLWVDGSYNATFYDSVEEAAKASLTYLKAKHPDDLIILTWKRTTLNGLPAIHSRVQFRSSKSGETLITDEMVALREYDDTGIIYTVTLTSHTSRYSADLAVMKQILEGWRTTDFE